MSLFVGPCCTHFVGRTEGNLTGGSAGCCCSYQGHGDPRDFAVLDILATCMHIVSWRYYKADMERRWGASISVPPALLPMEGSWPIDCGQKALRTRRELLFLSDLNANTSTSNPCIAATLMALLMEAEAALLALWPFSILTTDREAFVPGRTLAATYLQQALDFNDLHGISEYQNSFGQLDWPFPAALERAQRLSSKISGRAVPEREWYENAKQLGLYSQLYVAPTPSRPPWSRGVGSQLRPQRHLSPHSLAHAAARALEDIVASLTVQGLVEAFFPSKGTLLGFMRYGSIIGSLPYGKWDIVDNDLDFWVRVGYYEWSGFCRSLATQLIGRGWSTCALETPWSGISALRTPRTLLCVLRKPVYIVAEFRPFDQLGSSLVDTKVCGETNDHSLVPDTWLSMRENDEPCRYPPDGILTNASLVYPLAHCRAFNMSVPCPRRPADFLRELGYGPCLALPVILPTRGCSHPSNRQLRDGWTQADAKLLSRVAKTLGASGYESFASEDEEYCRGHRVVDGEWWQNCLVENNEFRDAEQAVGQD